MDYEIPLLEAKDIRCRVKQADYLPWDKSKVQAMYLLYKDSRCDMDILDRVFGKMNWQRTHEVIKNNLYCNVEVWDKDKKCWIRKQDVGIESHTEAQKGEASDAFKRADVNWGIGSELYTAPKIFIELGDKEYYTDSKTGKLKVNNFFIISVKEIHYNENRIIDGLVLADNHGKIRFSSGIYKDGNKPIEPPKKASTAKAKAEKIPQYVTITNDKCCIYTNAYGMINIDKLQDDKLKDFLKVAAYKQAWPYINSLIEARACTGK